MIETGLANAINQKQGEKSSLERDQLLSKFCENNIILLDPLVKPEDKLFKQKIRENKEIYKKLWGTLEP